MKRLTAGISLLVPVAAGAVRWLDLVNFCDLTTGFVLLGPVWARYLCMAMVLSLGVLASFLAARRPSGLVRRSMSLGLLCLLAGGAFAALAGVQLAALLGGAEADVLALEKCSYCGVKLLATAHAENVDELRRRRLYQILLETGVFRRALVLRENQQFAEEEITV